MYESHRLAQTYHYEGTKGEQCVARNSVSPH